MPLIGRLLRSITRTFSVTRSALILSVLPSSISAVEASGVGVGFGLRIGGGGGAPSCGAIRVPGPVCTGVGAGVVGVGVGDAVVVRGRSCALVMPATITDRVASALNQATSVPRRERKPLRIRKRINEYLV